MNTPVAKTKLNGATIAIRAERYADNGNLALLAFDDDAGEYYDALSVNLPGYWLEDDQCFFVKSETFSADLIKQLETEGVIEATPMVVRYGNFNSTATQYRLLVNS